MGQDFSDLSLVMQVKRFTYNPTLSPSDRVLFLKFCNDIKHDISQIENIKAYDVLKNIKEKQIRSKSAVRKTEEIPLLFAKSLLLDLLLQDWQMNIENEEIILSYTELNDEYPELEKEKIRRRHLIGRNEQLKQDSVQEFLRNLEKRRLTQKGWNSIFSLMRDGEKLQQSLLKINEIIDPKEKVLALNQIIKPYIQIVEPDIKCEHTGLLLSDIWRYFRHTWINEYQSLPGRSIQILIRDAAVEGHPVIGIAALGSAVAQQSVRDDFLGWSSESFIRDLELNPTTNKAKWILKTVDNILNDIYIEDFKRDMLLTEENLLNPTPDLIKFLLTKAVDYKEEHRRFPHKAKKLKSNSQDWIEISQIPLFKSKRAQQLADILSIRLVFNENNFKQASIQELIRIIKISACKESLKKLIRRHKAQRVGIDIMDIIVCGAVAPYNYLLGGKLVCMLLCSPEIVDSYIKKYKNHVSVIASAIKGSSVVRDPNLVFLGTTSLYGVGSSQYNRVRIPVNYFDENSNEFLEFKRFGISEGFGTFHLSNDTKILAYTFLSRLDDNYQKVNFIFGEGANPKMRKLSEAFSRLGLESENILKHHNYRVVYGVPLINNIKEFLIGYEDKPKYLLPLDNSQKVSEKISQYWIERWLIKRIENSEILRKVGTQRLTYPITHEARVPTENNDEINLFSDYFDIN